MTPDPRRLEAAARGLLGPHVAVAAVDPRRTGDAPLPAEEEVALARAIPRRRLEFAAGRTAARRAMAALGHPPAAIPAGPDRAPVWPPGLTGSITHTADACLAAVAETAMVTSVGIDLEPAGPLDPGLWPGISTGAERRWLAGQADPGRLARLLFCAKEAAYKAQYPLTRTLLDFDAMEIGVGPDAGLFTARLARALPPLPAGTRLSGRFTFAEGLILATVVVPAGMGLSILH